VQILLFASPFFGFSAANEQQQQHKRHMNKGKVNIKAWTPFELRRRLLGDKRRGEGASTSVEL